MSRYMILFIAIAINFCDTKAQDVVPDNSDLFIGNSSAFFSPFSTPFYTSILTNSNNSYSWSAPGAVSFIGQHEYCRRIGGSSTIGIGFGYPYLSVALNRNITTLFERKLNFLVRGGFIIYLPLFLEVKLQHELLSSRKNRCGYSFGYVIYSGIIHQDILPSTYPATQTFSVNLEGLRAFSTKYFMTYSVGYCFNLLRYRHDLQKYQKSSYVNLDQRAIKGQIISWQKKNGWCASFGIGLYF